jgi:hypothetical protein
LAVLLPLLLICGAVGSAAIVAYGTSSDLAQYAHGIQIIIISRRLEWPMVVLSLVLSGILLGMTISGRRGVWWLLGLGPVLALFVRGFSAAYHPAIGLLDAPQFVAADKVDATSIANQYVVGLIFDSKPYALPYSALADTPLILFSGFQKRALLIWSMTANRAVLLPLDRDTPPREIEVVSRPADSLLLFDTRLGQFIVGVTGRTVCGATPVGFGTPLNVEKMRFADWMRLHPDTLVMQPGANNIAAPGAPVLPSLKFPMATGGPIGETRIGILATTQPSAVLSDMKLDSPINMEAGETRILLERDPTIKSMRAFDRHLKEDLFLTFKPLSRIPRKHPEATLVDADTQSIWTLDGHAVDGPLKGERLHEIAVDDGLYWGVMKFWIPNLKLIAPQ